MTSGVHGRTHPVEALMVQVQEVREDVRESTALARTAQQNGVEIDAACAHGTTQERVEALAGASTTWPTERPHRACARFVNAQSRAMEAI